MEANRDFYHKLYSVQSSIYIHQIVKAHRHQLWYWTGQATATPSKTRVWVFSFNKMTSENINITIRDDAGIAIMGFNRPAKRNAFSQAMITEIITGLDALDKNEKVRAVVLTGGPGIPFCGTYLLCAC